MIFKKENGQEIIRPENKSTSILIKNGRVLDPEQNLDKICDIAIKESKIIFIEKIPSEFVPDVTIDATGMWVTPGLVDLHVHLREPGREDEETLETGSMAAAAGGFTAVACMPNTTPALDEESKIKYVLQRAEECFCRIYPIGAITQNREGKKIAPFGEMVKAGAKGVSDDGTSIEKSDIMRNAFNYAKTFNIPVMCHCEDKYLAAGGHMNESEISTMLGIKGIPSVAEEIIVSRDIILAEYTNSKVHIQHVSTKGSVDIIRQAKERGVNVTAETCPHYFAFTDKALLTYDTNKKMNPPLRTELDKKAIIEGLKDNTIDAIASDHAPHSPEEKDVEFDNAAFGVIGLETMLGASIKYLVKNNILTPLQLIEKMSTNPNKIINKKAQKLDIGEIADITIIDPNAEWTVDPKYFYSKSKNSAFIGEKLEGYAICTIFNGNIVYKRKSLKLT